MQKIIPANGGVLLEGSDSPPDMTSESESAPRVGYVIRVGNGVPWLKPQQAVIYDPRKAQRFWDREIMVHQRDILGVLDGVYRAKCQNGCHESPGSGCSQCPREQATTMPPSDGFNALPPQ